ncbi:Spore protein YkvP [compost metagenome]
MVINLHRAHDDDTINNNAVKLSADSPNPRTFEISASGTLQLIDQRADLARFYKPGVEIETYESPQELLEKVDFYLTHEKERRDIALRGLERTYAEHTYSHRINEMLSVIFG